jgi:hypothetical protein
VVKIGFPITAIPRDVGGDVSLIVPERESKKILL